MAFGKITKQDLVDAGLDPDKLADFQAKGVTKDDLNSLKTELATSVTDMIKAGFAELETKLSAKGTKNVDGDGDGSDNSRSDNPDSSLTVDEHTEFVANPTDYIKKKVSNLGSAAAIEFKKMARDLAYNNAVERLPGFKNDTIKKEIEEEWKKYTPEALARNGADPVKLMEQVHDMVMGRHVHEIMADRDKKDGKFNFVHSGVDSGNANAGGGNNNSSSDKKTLTPEEQKQARKFGMTDEDWLKSLEDSQKENEERLAAIGGRS